MHRGYVKLWRKLRDHEMMLNEGVCQLFLWILLHARSEPGKVQGVELESGQVIVGRHKLAVELKQNPNTIYKRLRWLQSRRIIDQRSNNRHTIVTLLNWDVYNGEVTAGYQPSNREVTARQQRSNNEVTQKKNEKNEKNITTPPTPSRPTPSRGKAVPEWKSRVKSFEDYRAWELEEFNRIASDHDWIADRRRYHPNLDILLTLEKSHVDYWGTVAGWKRIKTRRGDSIDWKATWTNALTMKSNQVWLPRDAKDNEDRRPTYQVLN